MLNLEQNAEIIRKVRRSNGRKTALLSLAGVSLPVPIVLASFFLIISEICSEYLFLWPSQRPFVPILLDGLCFVCAKQIVKKLGGGEAHQLCNLFNRIIGRH